MITPFRAGSGYQQMEENDGTRRYYGFTRILKEYPDPEVTVLDGQEILNDFSGLSTDLLHPSDEGHEIMAANLSEKLKEYR